MITLSDAEHILNELSSRALKVSSGRCVCVRNQHATCKACVDACPAAALSIENNHITIDPDLCSDCGACANVCPTQAIQSEALDLSSFAEHVHHLMSKKESDAWICCSKHPLASEPQEHLIILPCLAHIDEVHYLLASYYGIALQLLSNDCNVCLNRSALRTIRKSQTNARLIAATWNIPFMHSHRFESKKESTSYPYLNDAARYSRRSFIGNTGASLKHLGVTMASTMMEPSRKEGSKTSVFREKISHTPGIFDSFYPKRNTVLLNMLRSIQAQTPLPESTQVPSNFWGKVHIGNSCKNCGICAQICPTEALSYRRNFSDPKKISFTQISSIPKGEHEFRCADCINCRLCKDICPQNAISIQNDISLAELFDTKSHTPKQKTENAD